MNKVINQKRYNTKSARYIAQWTNGLDDKAPDYIRETLYRKHTGEFFLHVYGGKGTMYAEKTGVRARKPGEKLIPLEFKAAVEWSSEKLTEDEHAAIFGIGEDDGTLFPFTINLPQTVARKLRLYSSAHGLSVSEIVTKLADHL